MKRLLPFVPLIFLSLPSFGQGTKYAETVPVYQTEGRQRIFFSVSCSSSAWSVVVASDSISHRLVIRPTPAVRT